MTIALSIGILVVIGIAMLLRYAAYFPYRDDDNNQPVTVVDDWKTAVSSRERIFLILILLVVAISSVIMYPKVRAVRKQAMAGASR